MAEDWGSRGVGQFLSDRFSKPEGPIDPTLHRLRTPFNVCIVGASRGIGAGIATSYAKAGASGLTLASRRISGLEETARQCRDINSAVDIDIVACDITSAASVATLAEKCKAKFGDHLDVVVVNSGYSGPVKLSVLDTDPDTFQNAINVNYVGTFLCAKYLIPLLLANATGARAFIAVSSLAVCLVRGPIANAQYCVSKAAQLKLMENIHEQFLPQGLQSFSVHPGAVLSEMADETVPDAFRPHLTDSTDLCGAFCVWLTRDAASKQWLSGRLLSATWDVREIEAKREEIVSKDLLKLKVQVV
ncbi:hypothetical protein BDY17DRAFT_311789 [Neohortaea acidophila]|uniref:Uncharacterized protein n=1 Tax=Neohortaea acidophila TaxID=245834 RepID=A0A6A6PNZ4_9PEZI|nr:uncharacterized protein BDY17DRAFT_311789 [Neohortaea acidophila]KAF2480987.1 hypothetical protein BDY17DRAFT_311789 [Neohortaea acidophila]